MMNFNIYKDSQITLHTKAVLALVVGQKQLGIIRFEDSSKEETILAFRKTKNIWTVFLLKENGFGEDRTIVAYNKFSKKDIQNIKTEVDMINFLLNNSVNIDTFYNEIKLDAYNDKRAIIREKTVEANKQKNREICADMATDGIELHDVFDRFSHKNDVTLEAWEK